MNGGVVLVDTGFDETGSDVRAAVGAQPIVAVLLTHSHVDHRSGMAAVGAAPVYVGAADARLMRGGREYRATIQALAAHLLPRPALPKTLVEVADGSTLTIGGETFVALALPGHTPGSTVWLWRSAAFTGDAVGGDDEGIGGPPAIVSEDFRLARNSLSRLWGIDASTLYDGHGGRIAHARQKIERYLARHPEAGPPEAGP